MEWVPEYTIRFAFYWSVLALVGLLWAYLAVTRMLNDRVLGRVIVANFTLAFLGTCGDRAVSWLRGLTANQPPASFELFLVWLAASGVWLMWADLTGKIVVTPTPPSHLAAGPNGGAGRPDLATGLREKDHKP